MEISDLFPGESIKKEELFMPYKRQFKRPFDREVVVR
jgi:hypothetical protein